MKNYQVKRSKAAGFIFIICFIVPTCNWLCILSGFADPSGPEGTAEKIFANEGLYRLGLSVELLMAGGLVLLGVLLHSILKNRDQLLAKTALFLKLTEASLSAGMVLISYTALVTQMGSLGMIILHHKALFAVPMVFLGIDMIIFSYLFLKSKFIPWGISVFGIFSFTLIFVHSMMFIVVPAAASSPAAQIIFYTPSGLFELIMGTWLIVKGLDFSAFEAEYSVSDL